MPNEIALCNEKYKLCGPVGETPDITYTYSWYFNDPVLLQSIFVTNNRCFRPIGTSGYGSYTLMVTNQYGCTSSHTINVVKGKGCDGADPDPNSTGFNVVVYPNPAVTGEVFTIEMKSISEASTVEVINIRTGELVYTSELEYAKPLKLTMSELEGILAPSVYYIKIYNDTHIVTKRLIIK